jgi:hypothetical protein
MVLARLKLSRILGEFWWRRRDGRYGRFVESRAYPIVLDLFIALGFACVLVMLGYAAFERTPAALAAAVLAVAAYPLILAFLTSFGATFSHSVQHPAPAAEILARCKKLLARHDFVFSGESAGSLEAARGAGAGAETKWRSCPLEVRATVASEGSAALLTVQCTGEAGRHRFVRRLIRRTAEAAASLDRPTLETLDKTLVRRPGALFQGGLGTSVLAAMLVCAVISTAALVGVSYRLAAYVLDMSQASAAADDMRRLQVQLTSRIDAALNAEAARLAGKLEKASATGVGPAEAMRGLAPFSVPGELLAGVTEPQGKVALFSPASTQWTPDSLRGARTYGLARLGDRVVRELPQPQARELETQLALKPGQLVIGASLTHADLAQLAPERIDSGSMEVTFFESGRAFLRYAWHPGKRVQVDGGSGTIPADVLASAARQLDADWTAILRDVLVGGDVGGAAIRAEMRDGTRYRVAYRVTRKEGASGAWDGVSVARSSEPGFETREWILPLAVALSLIALLPVLIVTVVLASVISNRISRPALQIRDALRSIGEGDYSVRLTPSRGDEIGQVQVQLNKAAEELEKRAQGPSQ